MDYTQIILALIALMGAVLTTLVIPWIRRKYTEAQQDNLLYWTRIFVAAAETAFSGEQGEQKKEYVIGKLAEHGIRFDADTVSDAIEAVVRELTANHVID